MSAATTPDAEEGAALLSGRGRTAAGSFEF